MCRLRPGEGRTESQAAALGDKTDSKQALQLYQVRVIILIILPSNPIYHQLSKREFFVHNMESRA